MSPFESSHLVDSDGEQVAIVAFLQAALVMLVGFHALDFIGINGPDSVAAVVALAGAAGAVYTALRTNKTTLAVLLQLFAAGAGVAAIYGFNLNGEQSAAITALITAAFALYQRSQSNSLSTFTKASFPTQRAHTLAA